MENYNNLIFLLRLIVYIMLAHELRAWLLHYSPFVMYNILPDIYYQHLLLVEAIYFLLQDSISNEDLQQASHLHCHYCFFIFLTLWLVDNYIIH